MRSKIFTFPITMHSQRAEKINAEVPEMKRGTTFFDVAGIPVSLSPDGSEARAWDLSNGPRKFSVWLVDRRAMPRGEAEFRATVALFRELGALGTES
jgi:hypothetical protein